MRFCSAAVLLLLVLARPLAAAPEAAPAAAVAPQPAPEAAPTVTPEAGSPQAAPPALAPPVVPSAVAPPVAPLPPASPALKVIPLPPVYEITPPEGTPLDLETALATTLGSHPDLVAARQDLCVSAAAMAIARQFPTALNPTLGIELAPWTFDKNVGEGAAPMETIVAVSWMQPFELGRHRGYRGAVAQANFRQTQWTLLHQQLMALVETYKVHQEAVYKGERFRISQKTAEYNRGMVDYVRRQVEAQQSATQELILAEVEHYAVVQQRHVAHQEYIDALAAFRAYLGLPQYACCAVPSGPLRTPDLHHVPDEDALIRLALDGSPELQAARAKVAASRAAACLARAERRPVPEVGPFYEKNESGATFYGFGFESAVPVLNTGKTAVKLADSELCRDSVVADQLAVKLMARVRAAAGHWNQARALGGQMRISAEALRRQVERMEKLYQAGQAEFHDLIEVRHHLLAAETADLDVQWMAISAYATLLEAAACAPLIAAMPGAPAIP